ncbi:hypothetical protein chiPu_0001551 [Chiloscyllium punctatum]|uniref:Uncharacterized protein n=1 Tax=Chiloscyllium punctatum TaxID=137246 RepID=A0A401RYI6_CHIPU|nr:hypothetical protein [Chiloscyllium punctatum]
MLQLPPRYNVASVRCCCESSGRQGRRGCFACYSVAGKGYTLSRRGIVKLERRTARLCSLCLSPAAPSLHARHVCAVQPARQLLWAGSPTARRLARPPASVRSFHRDRPDLAGAVFLRDLEARRRGQAASSCQPGHLELSLETRLLPGRQRLRLGAQAPRHFPVLLQVLQRQLAEDVDQSAERPGLSHWELCADQF